MKQNICKLEFLTSINFHKGFKTSKKNLLKIFIIWNQCFDTITNEYFVISFRLYKNLSNSQLIVLWKLIYRRSKHPIIMHSLISNLGKLKWIECYSKISFKLSYYKRYSSKWKTINQYKSSVKRGSYWIFFKTNFSHIYHQLSKTLIYIKVT